MASTRRCGFPRALAALVIALAATTTSAQNLIVNSDMDGPIGFDLLPPGWDHAPPSSNTFDAATTLFQMAWSPSANGGTFAHAAGITNTCCASEGLSQTVSGLIPGATYDLSFEQSATWTNLWSTDPLAYWEVTFGAQTQNAAFVSQPQTQGAAIPWQQQAMPFTASASTQVLRFAAPQAMAFHPFSGTLFSLDDQGTGAADIATYDFNALTGNPFCVLPFEIVEQTATPDFGWGGLAFTRPEPWSNQGCALAGVFGDPLLVATGSMVPGSVNAIELSNAAPSANSMLFASLSSTPVPFVGGMLKPFPFLASSPIVLSPAGGWLLSFTIPPGWPSGTELWAQWAVQDVAAVFGVSLSNAVVGVVP